MSNLTVDPGANKQLYLPAFNWSWNCSGTIVYNASLESGQSLPSFIVFDNNTRMISIESPTYFDQGNYSVVF